MSFCEACSCKLHSEAPSRMSENEEEDDQNDNDESSVMTKQLKTLLEKLNSNPNFDTESRSSSVEENLAVLNQLAKMRFDNLSPKQGESVTISRSPGLRNLSKNSMSPNSSYVGNEDSFRSNSFDNNTDFEIPTEEMVSKIVEQVESYFTDFNIMRDNFLYKHIRRNKEGYISLKLVASFKRVKVLTKDWKVVRYCIRESRKLHVNEEGTKVKRIEPIPEYEDTSFAKTVILFNAPDLLSNLEELEEVMSKYGEIDNITIVTPSTVPPDVNTKRCLSYYKELTDNVFALVEYKVSDSALKAMESNTVTLDDQFKIVPLLSNRNKKSTLGSPVLTPNSSDSTASDKEEKKFNRRKGQRSRNRIDQLKIEASPKSSTDSRSSSSSPQNSRSYPASQKKTVGPNNASVRRKTSQLASSYNEPRKDAKSHQLKSHSEGERADLHWMNKRSSPKIASTQFCPSGNHHLPENVTRLPYGPDGTTGFHMERQVEETSSTLGPNEISKIIQGLIAKK